MVTWEIKLFYWTGYFVVLTCCWCMIGLLQYWIFEKFWRGSVDFYRVFYLYARMKYHANDKEFDEQKITDKDGKQFKIVEVSEE